MKTTFAERLADLCDQEGYGAKSALARALRHNPSTITAWLNGETEPSLGDLVGVAAHFGTTTDWLLGKPVGIPFEEEHEGFRWIVQIPEYIGGGVRHELERGIEYFKSLFVEQKDSNELRRHIPELDVPLIYAAFSNALRAGCLRITHVPTDNKIARQLAEKFPQLLPSCVHVVKLPYSFRGTLVYAEFAAFVAATKALPTIYNPHIIGVGGGYTLLRMAELSFPGQFVGVRWLPLSEFEEYGSKNNFRSANHIALTMALHNPRSESFFLSHLHKNSSPQDVEQNKQIFRLSANMDAVFISANGPGRQFRPVDYANHGQIYQLYLRAQQEGFIDQFGGEILGLLVDEHGQLVGDEGFQHDMQALSTRVSLDTLKRTAQGRKVWLIAAREYKAKPTLAAIRGGYINALVIDSEIATYLLQHG